MRLLSIKAKNFRTLQDTEISFSKNYCTISGRNNAGKSCIIRLLSILLAKDSGGPWFVSETGFDYKEDKTQWASNSEPITVSYSFLLSKEDDPALISFIEKIAARSLTEISTNLVIEYVCSVDSTLSISVQIDELPVDDKAAKEIERRLQDSNLLFLYNSTTQHEEIYFARGRRRSFFDFVMSAAERKILEEANQNIEKQIRRLAKDHVQGLTEILGKLTDKYDVDLSPPEGFSARRMPLGINLRDKNVAVPINDWGSGTQNRTHILMAILRANRIRASASPNERITPLVIIEEPESFLHPSAQAEFGRIIRHLSGEFGIQILVTTHSPYMLNQEEPGANILLSRRSHKSKIFETIRIPTDNENWMAPFSDHLGINSHEFASLRTIFAADQSKALLVEGTIDQDYFKYLQNNNMDCEKLLSDIEITAYGGKDTLKNTVLVKFVLSKFDRVYVTYDLDAVLESKNALNRAGVKDTNHCSLGLGESGKDCIEGLLPLSVLSAVNGRETSLVMQLGSTKDRKSAKDQLKQKYLQEFMSRTDYSSDELKPLNDAVKKINARLSG